MTNETLNGVMAFLGLLAIVFIALKLTGFIDWIWWWVLGPIWMPLALLAVLAALGFAIHLIKRRRW